MDVAVVGGGVIGLACAAEISEAGGAVAVFEAGPAVGQGSSARANGGFRAQFTTAPNIAFSRFSIEAFETMPADRIGIHQTGYVLLTGTDDGERSLRTAMALQNRMDVATRWIDVDEIATIAPFLRRDGLRGGTHHARDGFLDPAGVCAVLAERALAAGAAIHTDARVTGIDRVGDTYRLHSRSTHHADVVVNAAGPGAREVAGFLGVDLPVEPIRRNLAIARDAPGPLTPMLVDLDTGVLVRREPSGAWVLGYANPGDRPGRETTVDPRFLDDVAARLPHRFPTLMELPLDPRQCWAGLYPETPDHHAIVGRDRDMPGLVHCAGFGGHGVMHAPAAGRAVAELLAEGASTTFDLHPLRPSRFAEDDLVVESAVF